MGERGVDGEWTDDSIKLEDAFRVHSCWQKSADESRSRESKGLKSLPKFLFIRPGHTKDAKPAASNPPCIIHTFNFECSSLGDGCIQQLTYLLKKNINVKAINLGRNFITDEGTRDLADALKTNSNLVSLWLNHNDICDNGTVALAEALQYNSSLKQLRLDYNRIDSLGLFALFDALHKNSTISQLSLSGVSMRLDAANHLALALAFNTTLCELDLADVGLCPKSATSLAHSLSPPHGNISLRRLDLSRNGFGDAAATALARALLPAAAKETQAAADPDADHAASFCFPHGGGGESLAPLHRGATHPHLDAAMPARFGAACTMQPGLTHLDLSYNHLTTDGVLALAAALRENRSLRALTVSGNRCGDEGAVALAEAARAHAGLERLLFYDNSVGLRGTERASALIAAAPGLRTIDVIFQLAPLPASVADPGAEALEQSADSARRRSVPSAATNVTLADHRAVAAGRAGTGITATIVGPTGGRRTAASLRAPARGVRRGKGGGVVLMPPVGE